MTIICVTYIALPQWLN